MRAYPRFMAWLPGLLAVVWTAASTAHHSGAMYDASTTLEISGVLKQAQIGNPHSWFWIEARHADGSTVLWALEGGNGAAVQKQVREAGGDEASARQYFAAGQKVKASFHPVRDGRKTGLLLSLGFEDGRVFAEKPGV